MQEKKRSLFIVIPARFGSTRLPAKPLLKLGSKSMIVHVVERAQTLVAKFSAHPEIEKVSLIVATDHSDIFAEALAAGAEPVMTPSHLRNGSERAFVALQSLKQTHSIGDNDLILNIQGDEPFFSVEDVSHLITEMLTRGGVSLGTLATSSRDPKLFFSSSIVKVVRNSRKIALYFSRAPIPYPVGQLGNSGEDWINKLTDLLQDKDAVLENAFLHHIGVYLFRYGALVKYASELSFGTLERRESLEQLRALEAGWQILVEDATHPPFGIDTPSDLERARTLHQLKN